MITVNLDGAYYDAEVRRKEEQEYQKSTRPFLLEMDRHPIAREANGDIIPFERLFQEVLVQEKTGEKNIFTLDYPPSLMIGLMHDHGQGTPEDDVKALQWYRKTLNDGTWPKVYYHIGRMYRDGRGGVEKDLVQAFRFFLRSCYIPQICTFGRDIEARLTPAQRTFARKLPDTPEDSYQSRWCDENGQEIERPVR
jgi:TPR repeat protein